MKVSSFIKMHKEDNYKKVNIKIYQKLIRKLMYLLCNTRSDIAFAVGQLSKCNSDLKVRHVKEIKQVLHYFKETIYLEITYEAGKDKRYPYSIVGYAKSNYAGNSIDYKFVMRYCSFVNRAIVS